MGAVQSAEGGMFSETWSVSSSTSMKVGDLPLLPPGGTLALQILFRHLKNGSWSGIESNISPLLGLLKPSFTC